MKKFILFLTVMAVAQLNVQAQSSGTFTLQQCVDYAMQHNADVLNSNLEIDYAHKQVQQLTGIGLPQINGSVSVNDFVNIPTSLIPAEFFGGQAGTYMPVKFGTQYNGSYGANISQMIFNGSFFVGLEASRTVQDLATKNANRTAIEAKAEVMKAYYTALLSQKSLNVINANVAQLEKLKNDTKVMHDNGFVEQLDLDRITVAYNNLVTQKTNAEKMVALSLQLLKFQMGYDVNAQMSLTDTLAPMDFEPLIQTASSFNKNNRVEFQLLQTTRTLYSLDKKNNYASYLPSLYAIGSYTNNWSGQKFDPFTSKQWFPTTLIGAQLNVPIFDGFIKSRKIQEDNIKLQETDNSIANLSNAMNLEVNSSKISLENAVANLISQKDNMKLAQDVYSTANIKYQQGVGSFLEIINSNTALVEAQNNYLNALYEAWIASVNLKKALGTL